METLLANDVVAGPILDVAQLFDNEHVRERGTYVAVEDPELGQVRVQNVVPRFKRNAGGVRWLGKTVIGADTNGLLLAAGYSEAEIAALAAAGVVKLGPPPRAKASSSKAAQTAETA